MGSQSNCEFGRGLDLSLEWLDIVFGSLRNLSNDGHKDGQKRRNDMCN